MYLLPVQSRRPLRMHALLGAVPASMVMPTAARLGARRRRPMRRMFMGLGQTATSPGGAVIQDLQTGRIIDTTTGNIYDASGNLVGNTWTQPSGQPSGAVTQAYQNLLTSAQSSRNPLDYTTPQAAIAAGLDPQVVNAAWAKGMARFKTQSEAVAAGIPAGVVTQFWNASRALVGAPAASALDWLKQNWQIPAAIAGGVVLLAAMKRKRR